MRKPASSKIQPKRYVGKIQKKSKRNRIRKEEKGLCKKLN